MRYFEHFPQPILAAYVRCMWAFQGVSTEVNEERVLPDGCPELIFHFGDPYTESGEQAPQNALLIAGQITTPLLLIPGRTVDVLGVRFTPTGLYRLLDVPQHEFTDRRIAVSDFPDKNSRMVLQKMLAQANEMANAKKRFYLIEQLLLNWFNIHQQEIDTIDRCVAAIHTSQGQISMERLATQVGLSLRQLERRFLEKVGIAPKLLSRIVRFRNIFDRLGDPTEWPWIQIAADCGYFDQSHMIRDFQQFAGVAPRELLEGLPPLSNSLIGRACA